MGCVKHTAMHALNMGMAWVTSFAYTDGTSLFGLRGLRAGVLHLGCLSQSFRDEYYSEAYVQFSYFKESIQSIFIDG